MAKERGKINGGEMGGTGQTGTVGTHVRTQHNTPLKNCIQIAVNKHHLKSLIQLVEGKYRIQIQKMSISMRIKKFKVTEKPRKV